MVALRERTEEEKQSEFMRWIRQDLDRWSMRNNRFERDEKLYRLQEGSTITARNANDIIISNSARVTVKKFARLLARHPNLIDVPAAPGTNGESAQVIENWLYIYDQAVNIAWMSGLHHPYRYDQAFYDVLRGWQCLRTMVRYHGKEAEDVDYSDPLWFLDHQIFDPANVYPFAAGGQIRRVCHVYQATIEELREDPYYREAIDEEWGDPDSGSYNHTATATVNCCYWEDSGSWWHAVMCTAGLGRDTGRTWVKKPTELGYNPWTIVVGHGSAYQRTPWSDIDYLDEMGVGVLDDNADLYKYESRMLTKMNELLSLEVNPPVTVYTQNGQIKTAQFFPGARNVLAVRDKIEVHKFGPQIGDFQLLWDALQQRMSRATLPPAFFAEYGGESGFSASVLLAAGKDILYPFTEALNSADTLKYMKALELYRDFGPSKPLRSQLQPDGMGRVQLAELNRDMIKEQGTRVDVSREDMTPQEMIARINSGLAQVREKAISLETFRREYAKVRNPQAENLKVLAEQVYLSEDVIKTLIPMALSATGQEHLRRVWELTQNPLPPPEGSGGGGPTAGVAAVPGPPGAGGPPGGPPQMPGQAMPPIAANPLMGQQPAMMMQGLPAPPNPLLQLIQGGAVGGAGMGGVPPPAGTTSPIPALPFLPR